MANRFDEILDDCINRITFKGETVESCVKRYPEYAVELEQYLYTVAKVAHTYTFTPSSAAKEQARRRLVTERQAITQRRPKKRAEVRWRWWNFGWLPRWAIAGVVATLVILVGGASAVAASTNTLPGDALYPVKRTTEQLNLSLQLSPDGKAKLYLEHGERRANEMAALIKEGKTAQLAQLEEDLRQNLALATNALGAIRKEQAKVRLEAQVRQSATQALENLQVALQEAPKASRQVANDSFQTSSQAYGKTLETATAQLPQRATTAMVGTLQFLATGPPPPSVEKVLVTVGEIEVYLLSGKDSRWIAISQEPQTFDLLQITEIQKFLGQKQVESGTYTQVRFLITSATVVAGGVDHPAKVPSEKLSLIRPFNVEEGQTTSVLLDFDGSRSLQVPNKNEFIMKPVVNVLVKAPGEKAKREDIKGGKLEKERGKPGKVRGIERVTRAKFEGPVESSGPDYLVVQGTRIAIASFTKIEGKLESRQRVEVEAVMQSDGTFLASKIEVQGGQKPGKPPEKETSVRAIVSLTGTIERVSSTELTLDGRAIVISPGTRVEGTPTVGLKANVEGQQQPDGKILAVSIKVLGKSEGPQKAQPEKTSPPGKREGEKGPVKQSKQ